MCVQPGPPVRAVCAEIAMKRAANLYDVSPVILLLVTILLSPPSAWFGDLRTNANDRDSYFPLAIGYWWAYRIGGHSKWAGKTQRWTVTDRTFYLGIPEYVLSPTPALGWDSPLEFSPQDGGIRESGGTFVLKYPLVAGNRWRGKSQGVAAEGKLDELEVVSSGKPCSVGSHSFRDCVIIRDTDEGSDVFSLTTYARGVGPVKYVYFQDPQFKYIEDTMTIESWRVF